MKANVSKPLKKDLKEEGYKIHGKPNINRNPKTHTLIKN